MHRGRQSNGRLPPVLVVWVVHFAKKIDQPPTLGLKAPWLLQERCAAVSREPGVVHAPELRCGVRGRPPGVYQPAPRVHQTLINITKKFLHEPNPNPQSESFSARPPAARATRHAHDTPLEPTAAGYSSCDFSGARLGPHASLRRSAKFFGACGGQLDQILTNRRPAARTSTRSAGSLPNHIRDLYCDARERKPQQIFGACGGLFFSAFTIWRLWRVARSYGLHITRIDRANAYATARRHANTSHFFVLPRQIQNFRRLRRAGPDSPLIDKHNLYSARDRACRRRVLRRRYAPGGRF